MHTRNVVRALVLSLITAVTFFSGANVALANEPGTSTFSTTSTLEEVPVQACDGFDAVTDYTVTRDYHLITDYSGKLIFERRHVSFTGGFANTETGRAMPYQGEFTRIADYEQGQIVIADLSVKLQLPDAGTLNYKIDLRQGDLTDNPLAVLRELASHATATGLCNLLDGSPNVDPMDPLNGVIPVTDSCAKPAPGISMEWGIWVGC